MENLNYYEIFLICCQAATCIIGTYFLIQSLKKFETVENLTNLVTENPTAVDEIKNVPEILENAQNVFDFAHMAVFNEFLSVALLYILLCEYIVTTKLEFYTLRSIFMAVEVTLLGTSFKIHDIREKLVSSLKVKKSKNTK